MNPSLSCAKVLVVGAGIMGAGIAQVAAQAGHSVYLMDAREGAARQACAKLRDALDALLAKGKFTTAPEGHSGMGIFVSSRLMNGFAIDSGGLRFDPHETKQPLPDFDWMDAAACLKPSGARTLLRM